MNVLKAVTAIMIVFVLEAYGHALAFSAGAMAWYAWWEPHFEDELRGVDNPHKANNPTMFSDAYNDRFSISRGVLAGPVVSIRFFDDWTLGAVFLAGSSYTGSGSYDVTYSAGPTIFHSETDFRARRYDADCTLTYRVSRTLGIFAGYKYSWYRGTGSHRVTYSTYVDDYDVERDGTMYGPGLGLSVTIPLGGPFFALASCSVLAMKAEWIYRATNNTTGVRTETTLSPDLQGMNATAGIGYHFSALSTTCMAGVRYQYLVNTDDRNVSDRFYGVVLTALYSF